MATNYDVTVWVYDLSNGMAKSMSPMFLGRQIEAIYHTGIVVYGTEYYFGGGIAADRPGTTQAGAPLRKVKLGTTNKTQQEFHTWLQSVGDKYTAASYNILSHNCNNFAAACSTYLLQDITGAKAFPQEILDLPAFVLSTPMGQMFKPMLESMGPNSQGGNNSNSFIPTTTQHLALPDAIHNTPPSGPLSNTVSTTATPTSPLPTTVSTPTPPSIASFSIDFHRVTSLTEFDEVKYHTLSNIPVTFPSLNHDQAYITKMLALVKASYKHPSLQSSQTEPSIIQSQTDLEQVLSSISEKLKNPTLDTNPDYIKGLLALQNISGPYEAQSMVGIIGLYNLFLSQALLKSMLTSQESIDTSHQQTQGKFIHSLFDPLISHNKATSTSATSSGSMQDENMTTVDVNPSSFGALTFDAFVMKCINMYKTDIIPHLLGFESSTGSKMIPAVLRLLNTNCEQFFYLICQLSLTTQSQIECVKLLAWILDEYWLMVQKVNGINSPSVAFIDISPSLNQTNLNSLVKFALQLFCAYISSLKTNYQSRPPAFSIQKPISQGIAEHVSSTNPPQTDIDVMNETILEFLLSSILKIQEIFTAAMDTAQNDGVLKILNFVNLYLYNISYLMNGTESHCVLLSSLDIAANDTVQTWFSIVHLAAKKQQGNLAQDILADISVFIQLLADFDAVLTIGNRD